ncbi:MAG: hypothetical protein OXC26_11920 [Albidovulum sp.]|nr:hypothetical protein [Albidovulum sp.]
MYRQIGDREIRDALSAANGADPDRQMDYKQLFNFQYDDNARMTTFGGVFFDRASDADFRACAFERLKFFRPGVDHFRIRAPKPALREIAHLERQLPLAQGANLDFGPMPHKDANDYIELYRYLPTFAPIDLI